MCLPAAVAVRPARRRDPCLAVVTSIEAGPNRNFKLQMDSIAARNLGCLARVDSTTKCKSRQEQKGCHQQAFTPMEREVCLN